MTNVNERCAVLSSAAMVSARCARLYGTDDSGIPEMADRIIALRTAEYMAQGQIIRDAAIASAKRDAAGSRGDPRTERALDRAIAVAESYYLAACANTSA